MDFKSMARSLYRCRQIRTLNYGKALHCQLVKSGFSWNPFLANNLISVYGDLGFLKDAHQLFDEMPERNVVSWTTLISAYTHAGKPTEALRMFNWMSELDSEMPNSFTFSAALKACGLVKEIELGKSIHRRISRAQRSDTVLMNAVLDMYVKCGSLGHAQSVFDDILFPNLTSWNILLSGYCENGLMDVAVNLFHQMPEADLVSWNIVIAGYADKESVEALRFVHKMHRSCVKLDQFTFPCALKTCGCLRSVAMGEQIHCYVIKSNFLFDSFTGTALIDMYAKCGQVDEAMKLFNEYLIYEGFVHDKMALWNSMISGFAVNGYNGSALHLASQIHSLGVELDTYTFGSILKVCLKLLNLRCGIQVHGLIVTSGYHLDSIVGSILIELYVKCGTIKYALHLFRMLPQKDVVAWAGIIAACANKGLSLLAFSLFKEMVYSNIVFDQFVVSSVLKACSNLAGLEGGKQVHAYCIKGGYESEVIIDTSLIDMYTKCGEIEDALTLFNGVIERDVVCWTGIIVGCGQNGRAEEAIGLFQEMLKKGVKPNEITFSGVLTACKHAGLVAEAREFFRTMLVEHGLVPCLEHYSCMVDLLSKAGFFQEAEAMIVDMPYEPDETIWGPMLGACGIHNNVELCKRVAKHLLLISPDDASIYVMLANVYASLGMWDDSTKLREVIRKVSMKEAGRSWIEIRN